MADISVERARAGRLAANTNKARNAQQGTIERVKRSARNFVLPAMAAFTLGTAAPQAQPAFDQDQTEETNDDSGQSEGQAAGNLAFQQNITRQQQAQAARQQAGQQSRATAIRGAGLQKKQQKIKASRENKANAASEAAAEKAKRLPIRTAQRTFWTTAVLGSETVVLTVIFGSFWVVWKTAEFYRTVSGSDLGPLKNGTAKMNTVEIFTYLAGVMAIVLIIGLIVFLFGLLVWAMNHKFQALKEFPSLIPYLWQLL
ncbi:MAG: hypothetical protein O2877_01960 [bacterium]|nr:hypothetical protein [bacterium]